MVVAAMASVGETIAPRAKAAGHVRPSIVAWATATTAQVVKITSPTESSEIGRGFARKSRQEVKIAGDVEPRRQEDQENQLGRKLDPWEPR